ncbi:hypothetical protein BC940DRAFT_313862 [Gongronella butleri]|nr:hypothetical protein BC940DRAFT_313862 [Gongronella butleri]
MVANKQVEKQIATMHEQLVGIAQKCSETAHSKYNADDIRKLQNKLHRIDEKYQDKLMHSGDQDPYEIPGEAQIANELNVVHDAITTMLRNLE